MLKREILKKIFRKNDHTSAPKAAHLKLGERGERQASRYLKKRGYKIVEKDFKCKFGQIDLIAKDHEALCFIEVKCRSTESFGQPQDAITYTKQNRIKKISEYYMLKKKLANVQVRYDVVAIYEPKSGTREINLIKNAF